MIRTIITYFLRTILILFELVLAFVYVLFTFLLFHVNIPTPEVPDIQLENRQKVGENHYVLGNNYLKKNQFGVWEMYIEGSPYERGLVYGTLAKELVQYQEDVFVEQINQFIPSKTWQQFLKLFIGFFNSEIPDYIPLENQQEIYGISQSFSDEYNYIAPKYTRILNYHAAHDIGHALNDYSMVGCTSFSVSGNRSGNNDLLIGRNFDFYVGDDFAKERILLFVNPDQGYKFATYSWAGFTGVASGLNEKGISVTINASKSDMPTGSKMPISLLAREILQYASTIREAVAIAKKRHTFVSETLMIGSAHDGKTVLIEKSPKKMGVFDPNTNLVVCANHYQSAAFKNDPVNLENIRNSDSHYRFERMMELVSAKLKLNPVDAATILRDQYAAENKDTLGMGNPRALNQLLALHSVVIQPKQRRFYITTRDFQMGTFIGYDLTQTFKYKRGIIVDSIPVSPFVYTKEYQKFKSYKQQKQQISQYLIFGKSFVLSDQQVNQFIANNGECYITYEMLGKYFQKKKNFKRAAGFYKMALSKRVASVDVEKELKKLLKECLQKMK